MNDRTQLSLLRGATVAAACSLLLLSACGKKEAAPDKAGQPAADPAAKAAPSDREIKIVSIKPEVEALKTGETVKLALSAEMRGAVGNAELIDRVKRGGAQIVDARTAKEFSGEDIRAVRGGHVPGAVLIPYEQNWQDPQAASKLSSRQVSTRDGMALKSKEDLAKLYAKLDPEKETIVYCQSGVRASETAAVLRELGFKDVKVHEPSWLGYAGVLSAPAEKEVFVNVGALNGMVSSLAVRVRELEAEVARLQKR